MDFAQPKLPADQVESVAQPAVASAFENTFVAPDYAERLRQGERFWSTGQHAPDLAGRSVITRDYDDAAVLKAPDLG